MAIRIGNVISLIENQRAMANLHAVAEPYLSLLGMHKDAIYAVSVHIVTRHQLESKPISSFKTLMIYRCDPSCPVAQILLYRVALSIEYPRIDIGR